jgi:hypothetical protein
VRGLQLAVVRDVLKLLLLPGLAALLAASCANRRTNSTFRVVPADPNYFLRSPDLKDVPFPDLLSHYTGVGAGWVDLQPKMGLRIENAYYREGAPKHGLNGFLGTEIARYRAQRTGLSLLSVEAKLAQRPSDQARVQDLLRSSQKRHRYQRFFYQVVFKSKGESRGAVLLSANSIDELDQLSARLLQDADSVCTDQSTHCTAFPEACSVSIEMEIVINGTARTVLWGSLLASVVTRPRQLEVLRFYGGRLTPIEIDASDPSAMRLPLLPEDHINWK